MSPGCLPMVCVGVRAGGGVGGMEGDRPAAGAGGAWPAGGRTFPWSGSINVMSFHKVWDLL